MLSRFFSRKRREGYAPSVISPRIPNPDGRKPRNTPVAAGASPRRRSRGLLSRWWLVPVLGAVGAVFGMGIYYGYIEIVKSRWFALTEVQVEGTGRLAAEEVVAAAGLKQGASIIDVDELELENRILAELGWVRRVDVSTDGPSTLLIHVEERQAEAILADQYTCLVDNDGVVFKVMDPAEYRKEFVVLSGLRYYELMAQQLASMAKDRVSESLSLARSYSTRGLSEFVALKEVQFDEALGYSLVGEGGQRVVMGFGRHGEKMLWLGSIVAYLKEHNTGFDTVYMDNERRPEQVVVTGTGLVDGPLTLDMSRRVSSGKRPVLAKAER